MTKLGDEVGECVRGDQFAPNADPQFDPEGLYDLQTGASQGKRHE